MAYGTIKMAGEDEVPIAFGVALTAAAARWREQLRAAMVARGFAAAGGAGGDVLHHLSDGPLPQAALTQRMGLSKQAVQQLLDQLETGGLVQRAVDAADKRAKHVLLTDAGRAALTGRHEVAASLEAEWRDKLGKKPFKKLRKALRHIGAH